MKKIMLFTILVLFLVACSESEGSKLVGEWSTNSECDTGFGDGLIFNDDGSMNTDGGQRYSSWEMNEDSTAITLTNSHESKTFEYKQFDDDTISIINPEVAWQDINECQIVRN